MRLILGSQSRSRRKVLKDAGYDFEVMSADIDEKAIRHDDLEVLPMLIARAKTETLLARITIPAILLTSDQVVICAGELREKPESAEEARRYLRSYATESAQTNTAVVVTNTETGRQTEGIDIAFIHFRPIPEPIISVLIDEGSVLESGGAFIIEHPLLAPLVMHIDGTPDSVMGLPLDLTKQLIDEVL